MHIEIQYIYMCVCVCERETFEVHIVSLFVNVTPLKKKIIELIVEIHIIGLYILFVLNRQPNFASIKFYLLSNP